MYVIYALIDPRDNKPHSIGITDDVYLRFQQHLRCDGSNPRKDAWFAELKSENKMVVMIALEEVALPVVARVREAYWINHYLHLGMTLFNNVIPSLMNMNMDIQESQAQRKQKKALRTIKVSNDRAMAVISLSRDEAIRALCAKGYGKGVIIENLWNAKPGGSAAYKSAVAEYDSIVTQLES